jgi:UDP-3-O-[3-hydroxymyristoyl] glucosamine N-acyltransferase
LQQRLAAKVSASGGRFARLYDRAEFAFAYVSIGEGSVISATSDIGPRTSLGDHVMVMPMCWIAHDVTIGNFVTLAASCSISGHVVIEEEAFLGAGAIVVHGNSDRPVTIGAGARIAAGAVVTKSIPAGAAVAGNPARNLREMARNRR